MERFVTDGTDILDPAAELPLVTADRLLAHLKVSEARPERQREAVQLWLQTNLPCPVLRASLGAAGLLPWGGRR